MGLSTHSTLGGDMSNESITNPQDLNNSDNSFIARIVNWFDRSMFSLAGGAGPWIVPIAPALIYGWTFYDGTRETLGVWGVVGAVAMSVGLVVAGATSSHTAMALQSAKAPASKVFWAWFLVFAYITLEIGGIVTMNNWHSLEVVGVTASLLTLVVYLSRSFKRYLEEFKAEAAETKQEQKAERSTMIAYRIEEQRQKAEFERQRQLRQMELEQQKELAKIEASKEKAIAKNNAHSSVQKSVQAEQSVDAQIEHIVNVFKADPSAKITSLARDLNISRNTVYNRIEQAIEQQKLHKNGVGYKVTE